MHRSHGGRRIGAQNFVQNSVRPFLNATRRRGNGTGPTSAIGHVDGVAVRADGETRSAGRPGATRVDGESQVGNYRLTAGLGEPIDIVESGRIIGAVKIKAERAIDVKELGVTD